MTVGVHGVNYSDQTFSYVVKDPNDQSNAAGGEIVSRYAAGGTMCCFSLPKSWKPGLSVRVDVTRWPTASKDGEPIRESIRLPVPQYSEPGELWVLRLPDGAFNVVSSNVGPTHERWPGPVKGWPVPSQEFRRELWGQEHDRAKGRLKSALEWRAKMNTSPVETSHSMWKIYRENRPQVVADFSGPDDKSFHEMLLKDSDKTIKVCEDTLRQLDSNTP